MTLEDMEEIIEYKSFDDIMQLFTENKEELYYRTNIYCCLDNNQNLDEKQKIKLYHILTDGQNTADVGHAIEEMIFIKEYISNMIEKNEPIDWIKLAESDCYATDSEKARLILDHVGKMLEKMCNNK